MERSEKTRLEAVMGKTVSCLGILVLICEFCAWPVLADSDDGRGNSHGGCRQESKTSGSQLALRLEGKDLVVRRTNVVDVIAWSKAGSVDLYLNGVFVARQSPDAKGRVLFANQRIGRGVTDVRVEAGEAVDTLSWRYGETEAQTNDCPQWRIHPRTKWFQDARFGMFIHWGLYSIPAKGEWWHARGDLSSDEYRGLMKSFNPSDYDPVLWARLAKAAGMKYVVFTTRHHDGFCMFDSHFTDYKVTNTPYGKDVLKLLVEAFRAEGLRVGFYHSLPDWTHDGYVDPETPVGVKTGKCPPYDPIRHAAFRALLRNHVNQLTTEYGKVDLMFFDYLSKYKADEDYFDRSALIDICRRNQPDILINDRLSYFKDGEAPDFDYYTPEITIPNQPPLVRGSLRLWETCATLNDHWSFFRGDENFKDGTTIAAGLAGCVSRGGNLLLGVGPDERGRFPAGAVRSLQEVGRWFERNGESISGCGSSEFSAPYGCVFTQKGSSLYLHVLVKPLGQLVLPGLGDRVRKLTLLRTGEDVKTVDFWGFETLRPNTLRIAPKDVCCGDVIRLELLSERSSAE